MRSSKLFSIALISTLAFGTAAYAAGPGGMRSGTAAATTSGLQTRIHTPGTGLATGTPTQTQTQIHTPGTGLGTTTPVAGRPQQGTGRGIHTPGTGLTTPAVVPAPASN